jgi:DNA polymerase V
MAESCSALEPYALRVLGDSMAPEFWDGCVVIVDPGHPAVDQAYVIADVAGEVLLRQLIVDGAQRLLRPLNPAYPTVEWHPPHVLRGVVVQRAGTRRSHRKHYD